MNLKPYPKYKDSAVPWLRQIPDHWEIHRHGQLFREIVDIHHPDLELLSMTITHGIVKQSATGRKTRASEDKNQYKRIGIGDIGYNLMNCFSGAIGVSNYEGILSPAYAVCRPRQPLETWYYHYLFRTPIYKEVFNSYSYGIMFERNRLYFERFKLIRSPLPPKDEQIKIVKFLRFKSAQISRFIRAKRRIIKLLKEQKQAIINQVVTRGLDPNVKLKPSGVEWLGEIPEHWYMKRLKFVSKINNGQVDPKSEHYRNYILIAPNHIESATGKILYYQTASEQGAISGKYFVKSGQIIYSKIRPNLKKVCIAKQDCLCSADMYPITVNDKEILPEYFLLLLLSNPFTKYVIDCSMRVAMPKVNRNSLENCWLWYPSIEEQYNLLDILEKKIKPYDKAIERAKREIALMQEYRARLIADVVTGKVDVRDIEVPDVADEELVIEDQDELEDAEESIEEAEDEE